MNERPDPDALLERLRAGDARARRGKLKVFFGAAPGVGKTYTMLEAAQRACAEGLDVAVGWVDTHGRPETAALLEGLERLPRRSVVYRGMTIEEFDVDAALARRPALLLVDELAHANAEGSRHRKRWQDVAELVEAGIDVWSTLNVQHLESLNDVVAQITTVRVRETVPDSVLEQADEIELVDLPPEALLERLAEGKVYVPEQARHAVTHFFRKGNLLALRELALRRTAERVDADVRAYRREHGIQATWPAAEQILVCVGPGPHAARLVRAARRMAAGLRADWVAVYVETPAHAHLPQADRDWVTDHLRLAESLGGRVATLSGESVSATLLAYARGHNVTKILGGKPRHPRWRDLLRGSLLDEIIRGSGDIEVYVTSGDPAEPSREAPRGPLLVLHSPPSAYAWSAVAVAAATGVAGLMFRHFQLSDLVLVYLLATVVVATRFGRGPSALAVSLGVAAFDFCFVPPYFTFAVAEVHYLLTFAVMLAVGLTVGTLATRVRQQAEAAGSHAQWTAALHALSRDLARAPDVAAIAASAARHVETALQGKAVLLLAREEGGLEAVARSAGFVPDANEASIARWALDHAAAAGLGTDTLPGAGVLYLPLRAGARTVGVLGFRPADERPVREAAPRQMLDALAHQAALAFERALLAEEAKQTELRARTEELRNSLLSSVSHDLRTPLGAIMGAASMLLDDKAGLPEAHRTDLARTIYEEAERLNRLVTNLLAMTRLESGGLRVKKEWVPLEEVVGAALDRLQARLAGRPLSTRLPPDLPLVPMDPLLVEQVFVNLLENALRHTPPQTPIEIAAWREGDGVAVEVADRGPGLPSGSESRVFDKFFRANERVAGTGLGLTICRGIVSAHGGAISASKREGGGAVFRFTLPIEGRAPSVPVEEP